MSNKRISWEERLKYTIWVKAKHRAKQSGIDFNIDRDDIIIPETCPLLETKLYFNGDRREKPSLDRIHNDKGYTKGNVWVISNLANMMKQDATIEELKTFAKNVLEIFGE